MECASLIPLLMSLLQGCCFTRRSPSSEGKTFPLITATLHVPRFSIFELVNLFCFIVRLTLIVELKLISSGNERATYLNNNEYLECLTCTGPKRLHILYEYILSKFNAYNMNAHTHPHTHTHTETCTCMCVLMHTHTHTHSHHAW